MQQYPHRLVSIIRASKLAVIPTDTLYGVVASALTPHAVGRTYRVKQRDQTKPFIVLVDSARTIENTFAVPSQLIEKAVVYWPGAVSIILPCKLRRFRYLHQDQGKLAFRIPGTPALLSLLKETGPLIAPSANPEGKPPARTIEEAKSYFKDMVDFYVDGGELKDKPSTLIEIDTMGYIKTLRQGQWRAK